MRTALQSTDTSETAVKFKIMAGVSCEPGRRQAYSNDLRWRMVWQREVLGYKYDQIAVNLNVHPSTVFRVTKLFSTSGSVDHKPLVWRSQTPTARAGGSGVLSIRDFVPLECNALRNTYRNREARH